MNKKERVLRAFNNQETDKTPVSFWYHMPEDMDLDKECVQAHLDYYRTCDVDFLKIMCDGYFDYPNPVAKNIASPKEWYNMKPLGAEHPFIREQVERAKSLVKQLNGECCTFYNVFCPMSYLRFGTSEELLMQHIKEDPEAVKYAFSVIAKDAAELSRLLIEEAGCDGIYYCVQNAEKFRFSYEEYRNLVTPSDLYVLEEANKYSENNILHCCGWAGDENRVEVWQDYPAKAVNWAVYVEHMNLAEGKQFFGGKCVIGGFDNRSGGVLLSGTKEQVEQETEKLVAEAGKTGVILGADCTLPRGTDLNRICWVVEKLKEMSC